MQSPERYDGDMMQPYNSGHCKIGEGLDNELLLTASADMPKKN